jgi:hypothetical protein
MGVLVRKSPDQFLQCFFFEYFPFNMVIKRFTRKNPGIR